MNNKSIAFTLFFLVGILTSKAQSFQHKDIKGIWITNGGNEIEIYSFNNAYYGRIHALTNPLDKNGKPFRDYMNPEKSLRNRPILGIDIIMNLQFDGVDTWESGRIYIIEESLVVACEVEMVSRQKIRLIVDPGFFSHTEYWTRKSN